MGHRHLGSLVIMGMLGLAAASPGTRPAAAGPHTVASKLLTLTDPARERDVPVKVYYPADAAGACPVVIFSHGLGGSRHGYEYIATALASHGYVVVHPSHPGSDTDSLLKFANPLAGAVVAAADPANLVNRPLDVSFLIDQLPVLNELDAELRGKIDAATVGVAGHSFGAYTVMAAIGQVFPGAGGGRGRSFVDERIGAGVAMSSPTPDRPGVDLGRVYGEIKVPCLHMTGTLDDIPLTKSKAERRRIPFDYSTHPDTYLLTFDGGDHMTFSGRTNRELPAGNRRTVPLRMLAGTGADPATDGVFQPLIARATVAFFDAYLKRDEAAKAWLTGAFPALLGDRGTFERKGTGTGRAR